MLFSFEYDGFANKAVLPNKLANLYGPHNKSNLLPIMTG